jgi:hypothetical protein
MDTRGRIQYLYHSKFPANAGEKEISENRKIRRASSEAAKDNKRTHRARRFPARKSFSRDDAPDKFTVYPNGNGKKRQAL